MGAFGILPAFEGVAVRDGRASYRDYACTHALCNAHHLRELIYLEETTERAWPRKLIDFLCRGKDQAYAAKLAQLEQSPAVNLLPRLRQHADDALHFLADAPVPFDHNLGRTRHPHGQGQAPDTLPFG